MKLQFNKKEDALYIRFNDNKYAESDEVKEGIIFDYDSKGKIIGIEILDASKRLPRQFKVEMEKQKSAVKTCSCA
ncbi:MAG: DUF2283 domain-containing protein [Patescibacteria group bacterium]|jgi:uncharacterized protein YuzE